MPAQKNFRDVSSSTSDLNAGFQFEFFCERCGETWRSPFARRIVGRVRARPGRFPRPAQRTAGRGARDRRLGHARHRASRGVGALSDAGSNSARNEAQAEAIALAKDRYHACDSCHKYVGDECYDENRGLCLDCAKGGARGDGGQGGGAALACPNCQTPSQGGRFCAECGFDMASTHKSCPTCGSTMPREARFCGDCGHGF